MAIIKHVIVGIISCFSTSVQKPVPAIYVCIYINTFMVMLSMISIKITLKALFTSGPSGPATST